MNKAAVLWLLAMPLSNTPGAEPYPVRPIRLIVASPPGGAPDILGRTIAQKLSEALGQQIVVDNRAGASGIIGAEVAAKSAPDGYTLFLGTTTLYAVVPNLGSQLPYDAVRDFASITQIALASNILVASLSMRASTVADLVQLAKTKPGSINYASAGNGTPAHLAGEMFNLMAGVKMTHVPYKGAGPALFDVIAGHVQIIITSPIAAATHVANGKVRALATTGSRRNPTLPELPTVAETLPGYEITQWWGLSAPVRTPHAIVQRLHDETTRVLKETEVRERIHREGATPVGNTAREFDAFIAAERARLGNVIRKAGIRFDG
ncbi:MAG TPA: tripartite tricarboxylate transporter substrate binding protein [Burkholderiales bacterium]|nr:tripartite tricarboxylate transporter substrate binding protein [Burkholderiales bacterium]